MYSWGDDRPFYSYATYCRRIFGRSMLKLPVNAGFTCPNRDGSIGTKGCSFCLNEAFIPRYCDAKRSISEQLSDAKRFFRRKIAEHTGLLAYFQAYSGTYAPIEQLMRLYEEALSVSGIDGLVIATRPDCVDETCLDYLADVSRHVYVCIEYGIESTDDNILCAIGRGHDYATTCRAIEQTVARNIHVGGHLMLGLPGHTEHSLRNEMHRLASFPLDTIKFHQLQIFRGTPMADEYKATPSRFLHWSAQEYIEILSELIRYLPQCTAIERIVNRTPLQYRIDQGWQGISVGKMWQMLEETLRNERKFQGDFYTFATERGKD